MILPIPENLDATTDVALPQWSPPTAAARPRTIGYLRLSVTRGCSMRCTYCRPDFDRGQDPAALDADDLAFLVGHLHERFGLRKVRITGGEPTTRRDLGQIVRSVAGQGVPDVAMTTNGLTLTRDAAQLREAGLRRVNVSLDTLDRGRFAELTGVDGLARVLAGIDTARGAGFAAVKINTVVVAGQNEQDLPALVGYAATHGLPIRFIELMPMGPLAEQWEGRYVSEARMRRGLDGFVRHWQSDAPDEEGAGRDASRMYTATLRDGRTARVGFITPMSNHFCETCDRLRVTADGSVYPCLMDRPRGNVAAAVRGRDGDAIDAALGAAFDQKADVHPAVAPGIMTHIGG